MVKSEINSLSPLTLAFLGDAVYEQMVREKIILEGDMPVSKMHDIKIQKVCASFQSEAFEIIKDILTEDELAIFKRGRNASGNTIPKSADVCQYRRATGLECLFGYLWLMHMHERIKALFEIIWNCG